MIFLSNKNLIVISMSVIIGFALIIMSQHFFDKFIYFSLANNLISHYISGSIIRFVILFISIIIMIKLKLYYFAGLTEIIDYNKSKIILPPAIILIILLFFLPYDNIISKQLLLSFILFQLLVGFAEEFSMRGILLPLITKYFINTEYAVYYGLFISSFAFAILHYLSFLSGSQSFESSTNQVIFAFGIGVYFGSLLLRNNNLIYLSLIHALVNITGKFKDITFNGTFV